MLRKKTTWITTTLALFITCAIITWANLPRVIVYAANHISSSPTTSPTRMKNGDFPQTTTITDKNGDPIAWFYTQRRHNTPPDKISQHMKDAIVAIEDKRFYKHKGVDYKGTLRAGINNLRGKDTQGASTLDQQYVKNYSWLIDAHTDQERDQATAQTYDRKIREMAVAMDLERSLTKDEILGHYLNLVTFGNGSYGIGDAARTYFDTTPDKLTVDQSALLAGLVQSPTAFDPYQYPKAAKERRDTVLHSLKEQNKISSTEYEHNTTQPLGVLPTPHTLPQGCAAAETSGYFCDYVRQWLTQHGFEDYQTGGYTIKTSLDPNVQKQVQDSLNQQVPDPEQGAVEVMNTIQPDGDRRWIRAMAASTQYGLGEGETTQGLPFTNVGRGAGSIFKLFAAAEAIDRGMGIDTVLDVPPTVQAKGMGTSDTPGCPANRYCVSNVGNYPAHMTLREALAQSPNTPFVRLVESVGLDTVVDRAVKMGLRSYAEPQGDNKSVVQQVHDEKMGSFVLGPTAVSGLELANVGAAVSSGGVWCEPSPVVEITDAGGKKRDVPKGECERVLDEGEAHALSEALSDDVRLGTASGAARQAGWGIPLSAKTGTTEGNGSAAFLGFNSRGASSVYAFAAGGEQGLCTSPLRTCGEGDVFGGLEPARTFVGAMGGMMGGGTVPPMDDVYKQGTAVQFLRGLLGKNVEEASRLLQDNGYPAPSQRRVGSGFTVRGLSGDAPMRGAKIVLDVG